MIEQSTAARKYSRVSLILANLVPVFGVLFGSWTVSDVMIVYWLENVVVGFFNVLRMVFAQGGFAPDVNKAINALTPQSKILQHTAKLFFIPFFIVHYGMFTMIHGVFVVVLFGSGGPFSGSASTLQGGPFAMLSAGLHQTPLFWPILALMLSHGISFWFNYIKDGEYLTADLPTLMSRPYGRIVVLHLTIILGGFAVMAFHGAWGALVLLTILKIGTDLKASDWGNNLMVRARKRRNQRKGSMSADPTSGSPN
ncbi:hypothetical protein CVU37_13350 [candidate division BRC1 bacterium HGW-BRC1-1]|jgi:hypothetical protein|nr:MAG: hypothetical protein CVU37_13350 [candidate division BRC1 bacterium HGW-BRC1-1]